MTRSRNLFQIFWRNLAHFLYPFWKPSGTFRFPVFNEARKWGRKWVSEMRAWKWRRKCLERWPLGHKRESSFRFTSGLLPRNARNTDAGPLVPLDARSHIFSILMVFHLYFNDLTFSFRLLPVKLPNTFQELP